MTELQSLTNLTELDLSQNHFTQVTHLLSSPLNILLHLIKGHMTSAGDRCVVHSGFPACSTIHRTTNVCGV